MENFEDPRMEIVRDDLIAIVRDKLKEVGDRNSDYEYNLTENPYGFATAWIEDDVEVWWDKTANAMQMDEVTELAALYETICKTEKERAEQNDQDDSPYICVTIRWIDSGDEEDVIFKTNSGYDDADDDVGVFWWCNSRQEIEQMIANQGKSEETFEVIRIND